MVSVNQWFRENKMAPVFALHEFKRLYGVDFKVDGKNVTFTATDKADKADPMVVEADGKTVNMDDWKADEKPLDKEVKADIMKAEATQPPSDQKINFNENGSQDSKSQEASPKV